MSFLKVDTYLKKIKKYFHWKIKFRFSDDVNKYKLIVIWKKFSKKVIDIWLLVGKDKEYWVVIRIKNNHWFN